MMDDIDLGTLVSNVIAENRYSHCRLCLSLIQAQYVRFSDAVSLDPKNRMFQPLSDLLERLFGDILCDEVPGIDAVCEEAMSSIIPIILSGDNLGERHRQFNSLLGEAYQQRASLEIILQLPETSPIDKLFKIDFAAIHRNVEFIVDVLKDENMLYVSRALKCTWLLHPEYQHIINPDYLETHLYPYMITPAVNKIKHWIQNNLRDANRCQEFYRYYGSDYDMKIKFLRHCTTEFITFEFLKIIDKVTPKQLKILCECCPKVLKLYYDNFISNPTALDRYLQNERQYMDCCKYVLKVEPDIYFDVVERYHDHNTLKSLSPVVTDYVMSKHRGRFLNKPELYAVWLLHKETVAKHLNDEEAKDIVLRLARAEYLGNWFSYKNVEPFIKRLKPEERAAFKKRVFVEKAIGDTVKDWPYPTPARPKVEKSDSVFDDMSHRQLFFYEQARFKRCIKKRKMGNYCLEDVLACPIQCRKTVLNELFDRYRFHGFDRTLFELQKLLRAESSVKNREFMMLVLVSKCGENMEQVDKLLRLLAERYCNESGNLRATIVRSLVVRACVWRLPPSAWSLLLDFARGLGLDGNPPMTCREGMHAVVLRLLLAGEECPQPLRAAFLDDFCNFTEYKLSASEKRTVRERLPALLLTAALAEPDSAIDRLQLLLDTLSGLKVRVTDCPGALEALIEAVRRDPASAESLLIRIYNQGVARRELLKENFELFKTNESYLNVLRHDATILRTTKTFEESLKSHTFNYDGFLRKLSLYFGETGGLASLHIEVIKRVAEEQPHVSLARPLGLLSTDLAPIIDDCMKESKGSPKKQFGTALQSNYNLRKLADVDGIDWHSNSAKAIVNRVIICRAVDVDKYIQKALKCRRTLKLALLLAERGGDLPEVYEAVRIIRPGAALRSVISYFKRNQHGAVQIDVWRKVAPVLEGIDLSLQQHRQLSKTLQKGDFVPTSIKAEYYTDVYKALQRASKEKAIPIISMFENLLPVMDTQVIRKVIEQFLEEFTLEAILDSYHESYNSLRTRIVAKYLLLSKSEEQQKERLDGVWQPFYERLAAIFKEDGDSATPYLERFVEALKYNRAFFDSSLVSCAPVFERVVADLRKLLPVERFIDIYVAIHATMLYRNSIERVLRLHPQVFKDAGAKRTVGAKAVGRLFGKLVGHEVRELAAKFFKTIIEPYQRNLTTFMQENFGGDNGNEFTNAFVGGLIDVGSTEALRVAEFMLHKERHKIDRDPEKTALLKRLEESNDEELKFFLYADFHSGCLTEAG
ncbi:unnamed protein product, partial [Iphiclides podalirius]